MTPGEMLRDWAVRLRSICESQPGTVKVTLELDSGARVSYAPGTGLFYETAKGRLLEVPESALDEERWMVAGA